MKSNLPTLLGQQDFMFGNWDMVKSARLESLTDEQIEYNKRYASISMRKITEYYPNKQIDVIGEKLYWFTASKLVELP